MADRGMVRTSTSLEQQKADHAFVELADIDERRAVQRTRVPAAIMNAMAEMIVVTGPPGAGKSTVTRLIARMFDPSALVAGDDFFGLIDQGYIAPWTTEAHHQNEVVIGAAAAASGRLVTGGYTVVYDGVIGPWFLEAFGTATTLDHLHYAVLLPPEQVCSDRVASRVGHGFTDLDAAHQMYVEFARSDTEDRHIIEDQVSPESIASIIAQRTRDGLLKVPLSGQQMH